MQQEIPQKEAVQGALIQLASEKQAAQLGPLLRRNVEGVKLEAAHCLKLEAVHSLSLRILCETTISEVPQFFMHHLIFTVSGEQKAPDLEQSFSLQCLHHRYTSPCSEERSQLST